MRQIVFRHQARRELDEAGDWYEQERIGLGLEFFAEIERCCIISRIAKPNQSISIFISGGLNESHIKY